MSPVRSNWIFTSKKNNDTIFVETEDEYNFCFFLEFDTRIRSFLSQPQQIQYHTDQECHQYTADFYVITFSDGEWYFEIKYEFFDIQDHQITTEKYESIKYDLNKQGFNFLIIDKFIKENQITLENMKRFKPYRGKKTDTAYTNVFKEIIAKSTNHSIKIKKLLDLTHKLTGQDNEFITYQAFSLISDGLMTFDVSKNFSMNTEVGFEYEGNINIWNAVPLQR